MRIRHISGFLVLVAAATGTAGICYAADPLSLHGDASQQSTSDGKLEVLTRGPVHEAYAEPVVMRPEASPEIEEQIPDSISESPPTVKPDGNVMWIPGYWAWNDQNDSWVWVTGTWRAPPPGTRWVPGYWTKSGDKANRWVSGFWMPQTTQNLSYLPTPPEPQSEKMGSPPSAGDFWAPGHWEPNQGQFQWQAGYWTTWRPNWVWAPPQYHWTPAGQVLTAGYWDYPLTRRGWLFAPVGLTAHVQDAANVAYSPNVLLNTKTVSMELFARPNWAMYYFGDYYGAAHTRQGFYPWYKYARLVYDPIYTYQNQYYGRRDPNWLRSMQHAMRGQAINPNRPGGGPVTESNVEAGTDAREMVIPLHEFIGQIGVRNRVQGVGRAERADVRTQVQQMLDLGDHRRDAEMRGSQLVASRGGKVEPAYFQLPASPTAADHEPAVAPQADERPAVAAQPQNTQSQDTQPAAVPTGNSPGAGSPQRGETQLGKAQTRPAQPGNAQARTGQPGDGRPANAQRRTQPASISDHSDATLAPPGSFGRAAPTNRRSTVAGTEGSDRPRSMANPGLERARRQADPNVATARSVAGDEALDEAQHNFDRKTNRLLDKAGTPGIQDAPRLAEPPGYRPIGPGYAPQPQIDMVDHGPPQYYGRPGASQSEQGDYPLIGDKGGISMDRRQATAPDAIEPDRAGRTSAEDRSTRLRDRFNTHIGRQIGQPDLIGQENNSRIRTQEPYTRPAVVGRGWHPNADGSGSAYPLPAEDRHINPPNEGTNLNAANVGRAPESMNREQTETSSGNRGAVRYRAARPVTSGSQNQAPDTQYQRRPGSQDGAQSQRRNSQDSNAQAVQGANTEPRRRRPRVGIGGAADGSTLAAGDLEPDGTASRSTAAGSGRTGRGYPRVGGLGRSGTTNANSSLGRSMLPGLTVGTGPDTSLEGDQGAAPGGGAALSRTGPSGLFGGMSGSYGSGIYNGIPMGTGNTLGGSMGVSGGGLGGFPSGIGSGYQGGMPTGGTNAPGGSYGLGTPSMGGGNFYGASGGGASHGSPGSGT